MADAANDAFLSSRKRRKRDRLVCPICHRKFPSEVVFGFCADGHPPVDLVRAGSHLSVVKRDG